MPRYVYDRPQLPAHVEASIDALGSAARLAILAALRGTGPATADELAEATGMGARTIRRHLDALEALGAVTGDEPPDARHGRRTTYALQVDRVQAMYRDLGTFLGLT